MVIIYAKAFRGRADAIVKSTCQNTILHTMHQKTCYMVFGVRLKLGAITRSLRRTQITVDEEFEFVMIGMGRMRRLLTGRTKADTHMA